MKNYNKVNIMNKIYFLFNIKKNKFIKHDSQYAIFIEELKDYGFLQFSIYPKTVFLVKIQPYQSIYDKRLESKEFSIYIKSYKKNIMKKYFNKYIGNKFIEYSNEFVKDIFIKTIWFIIGVIFAYFTLINK